jgi:N-acyl amino acid synthase of PEP-CTERM/exosortase system
MHTKILGNTEFLFRELSPEQVEVDAAVLRFKVFCQECGFLPEADYPGGKELDEYDDRKTAHFGLYAHGELGGYARLLMRGPRPLPFFRLCPSVREELRGRGVQALAELSRVMVNKQFRRRKGDVRIGLGEPDRGPVHPDRRVLPATLGLYREALVYALSYGLSHCVALMEPSLDRLLRHFAIRFEKVGPPIDYGGLVYPYLLDISRMLEDLKREKPKIFSYFMEGLPEPPPSLE